MIAPNFPVTYDATPAEDQPARADIGEQTGPQQVAGDWLYSFGWGCANGGTPANPCGFPQYGTLYRGTYETYDLMLEHPVIQDVRSQVFDPIIASKFGYESKPGTSTEWVAFIKDMIEGLQIDAMPDILRALDYGWVGFEKIWEIEKGRYIVRRLKPLHNRVTGVLADPHGNFAGLRWNGNKADDLNVWKSLHVVNDSKFGYLFGRSRLENLRLHAWREWLDAATDMARLCIKISGKLGILTTPAGKFKKPDGTMGDFKDVGTAAAQAILNGANLIHLYTVASQAPGAGQPNFDQSMKLFQIAPVQLQIQDFGTNSPAIAGILARMEHAEQNMSHGYLRPPRTSMEAKHGSKADSVEHTNTATLNPENLLARIARALSRQVIDHALVLNFGQEAKGSVWVSPSKLTDENLAVDNKVLDAVFKDPDLRGQAVEAIGPKGMTAIFDRRNIPHDKPILIESVASDTLEEPVAALEGADTQE